MVVLVVGIVLLVPAWLGATPSDPEPCPLPDQSQSPSPSPSPSPSKASRLRTGPVQPTAPARSGTSSPVPDRAVAPKRAPPAATATAARGNACRSRTAAPLVVPPVVELSRTPAPPPPVVQRKKDLPHLRQPIPLEGFPAGDFLIQPTITLSTDCRYGDPRSRDRSWMEELDSQDARLRGERKDDPLLSFLKGPGKDNTGKKTDPGYQIAATIGHRLQPVPSTTAPLRALEHTVVIAPGKPGQASAEQTRQDALRRSIATITRRPAATGAPTRQATPSARRPRPVRPPHPAADLPIPQLQ